MNPYISALATLLLIYRAYSRRSLTPPAILAAALTAIIHSTHPTALPFSLLITFYLLGTTATKVKKHEKAQLTVSSGGGHGEHEGRGVIQVLANSGVASLLCVIDLCVREGWIDGYGLGGSGKGWFGGESGYWGDVFVVGIVANYAATTADTLSSELGILSKTKPRLVLNPFKICPPGTNGAVSALGLAAGAIGAFIIGCISSLWFTPTSSSPISTLGFILFTTFLGLSGSLVDSILGAIFQQSVIDVRTQRIVENPHGGKVLVVPGETSSHPHHGKKAEVEKVGGVGARGEVVKKRDDQEGSRKVVQGWLGWLDNNEVNVSMAVGMSLVGMGMWGWLVEGY